MSEDDEFQRQPAAFETTAYPMLVAHAEKVSHLSGLLANDSEIALRERVWSLTNGSTGERRAEIFLELCELVRQAFPDEEPTDLQVLTNSATPDLVRYLLASLRRFTDEGADPKKIGRAFLATEPPGNPHKHKMLSLGLDMREAAWDAHKKALKAGRGHSVAYAAARDAAYSIFRRGEKEKQDERDKARTLQQIEQMFDREGLSRPSPEEPAG